MQQRVDEVLQQCTTQSVLQPTGCPFGYAVPNCVVDGPTWSMVKGPAITLEPVDEGWKIPPASATAHVTLDVKLLYDGTLSHVDQDVPFQVDGTIRFLPDGSASISITSPEQSGPPAGSEG